MKSFTLKDLALLVSPAGEDIPVTVKAVGQVLGKFQSFSKVLVQCGTEALEAKVREITLGRDEITIVVRLKDFCTKI